MKKGILAFIFTLAPSLVYGVEFNPKRQILMNGRTCAELEAYAKDILAWTEIKSNSTKELPECFCSSKSCQIDAAPISPYFVNELTNFDTGGFSFSSAVNGPNCFNAALVGADTLSQISFTHPYEMTAILHSSLCREREISEELMPGDLLVIRNQADPLFEIHAAISISEKLSFSKYGESQLMPYSYGTDVEKSYGVRDESCLRVKGLPRPGSPCHKKPFVNFYSCQPLHSFISKIMHSSAGLEKGVQGIYAETSSFDLKISDMALKGRKTDSRELAQMQNVLRILYSRAHRAEKSTADGGNKELARLMRFRIFSLFEQVRRIAVDIGDKELAREQLPTPRGPHI